jgi:hypothetical protein
VPPGHGPWPMQIVSGGSISIAPPAINRILSKNMCGHQSFDSIITKSKKFNK